VGDGGNVEGPYRSFVDEVVPGSNTTYCAAAWSATLRLTPDSNAASGLPPSYQSRVHPPACPTATYQRAGGVRVGAAGAIPDARNAAPAEPRFFCQSSQPAWSAFREPAFGFAGLTLLSDDSATFTWCALGACAIFASLEELTALASRRYRNVDQAPGAALRGGDSVTYTRYKGACPSTAAPPAAPPAAGRNGVGAAGAVALTFLFVGAALGGAHVWRSRRAAAVAARGAAVASEDDSGAGDVRLLPR